MAPLREEFLNDLRKVNEEIKRRDEMEAALQQIKLNLMNNGFDTLQQLEKSTDLQKMLDDSDVKNKIVFFEYVADGKTKGVFMNYESGSRMIFVGNTPLRDFKYDPAHSCVRAYAGKLEWSKDPADFDVFVNATIEAALRPYIKKYLDFSNDEKSAPAPQLQEADHPVETVPQGK